MPNLVQQDRPKVLVVDDDIFGLDFLSISLRMSQFDVITAQSVAQAKEILFAEGIRTFDCILTDYRMPQETGLDLLDWVQNQDTNLSTIILTAEGEKELVQKSLRQGAIDFLEKPINRKILETSIARGVTETKKNRKLENTRAAVQAVSKLSPLFTSIQVPELEKQFDYFIHPLNDVGGDFLNLLPLQNGEFLFLLGDVSGHDVRAAFISAYFQGLVRGLWQQGTSLNTIIKDFNKILSEEWAGLSAQYMGSEGMAISPSLAIIAACIDFKNNCVKILNCGFPEPLLTQNEGLVLPVREGYAPLGWFPCNHFEEEKLNTQDSAFLYAATDGLYDYAEASNVDPLSLIYRLLSEAPEKAYSLVENAKDDILAVRVALGSQTDSKKLPNPLINQEYTGERFKEIDEFQEMWRKSFLLALPDAFSDRLYDVLVCCREGVLNAMVHGCNKSPYKAARFQVFFYPEAQKMRVVIEDPGPGYSFDIEQKIKTLRETGGSQMGLAMIKELCSNTQFLRNGALLIFDFNL